MDIETIKAPNGDQVPMFISFSSKSNTEFFLINIDLGIEDGVNNLFMCFFDYLLGTLKNKSNTIFVPFLKIYFYLF